MLWCCESSLPHLADGLATFTYSSRIAAARGLYLQRDADIFHAHCSLIWELCRQIAKELVMRSLNDATCRWQSSQITPHSICSLATRPLYETEPSDVTQACAWIFMQPAVVCRLKAAAVHRCDAKLLHAVVSCCIAGTRRRPRTSKASMIRLVGHQQRTQPACAPAPESAETARK